jgi:hypothetical protein
MSSFHNERDTYLEAKFNELDAEGKGYLNKQETFEMFKQIHELDQGKHRNGRGQGEFTIQHFDRMFFLLNSGESDKSAGLGSSSKGGINRTQMESSVATTSVLNPIQVQSNFGRIYKAEFMKIFEVYELWKYET